MGVVIDDADVFWLALTRLGQAEVVMPAAVLTAVVLWRTPEHRSVAIRWLAGLFAAGVLTTASKVAFIGWGWGSAALDFTGISGHAMLAAVLYPVLLGLSMSRQRGLRAWHGVVMGTLLALAVGESRIRLHAHSVSEVAAGLALGAAVSCAVLAAGKLGTARAPHWAMGLLLLWLIGMPASGPPSHAETVVARLALAWSGRERLHTRAELHLKP
ncbi:MAG: phosphatase PAP2 family protein [Burkholderiales bacterium]|nr:phosphatase PAP2 family protein [Burkholderiales bacterium]